MLRCVVIVALVLARPTPSTAGSGPSGADRIVAEIVKLRDRVRHTRYQAATVVKPKEGLYAWDCSGMAAWILAKATPAARRALSGRPVARDFFHVIERAPTARPKAGWQRLPNVAEVRAGDVFAWLRSPASVSKVTGHVGFFVEQPVPLEQHPHIYMARIVDSTRLPHGGDTRTDDGIGGFGFGTMLFVTNADGETIAYGWHGLDSLAWGFMPARVIYGRVAR
jgi:hypothetical protein